MDAGLELWLTLFYGGVMATLFIMWGFVAHILCFCLWGPVDQEVLQWVDAVQPGSAVGQLAPPQPLVV